MSQMKVVFRGVEHGEAMLVIDAQRYSREERRHFINGASAKAVFGSGVYLVSNPEVAAHYAICHAETTWDKAAVLQQKLLVSRLFVLDRQYGENELRRDALAARHTNQELVGLQEKMTYQEWLEWTGGEVRSFLLDKGYQGIQYEISPELTYYICYQSDSCITDITLYAILDLQSFE